jgi:hypothetical protein
MVLLKQKLYKKKINLKKLKVNLDIKSNFFINKNKIIFFGNPIYTNFDNLNINNIFKEIKNIKGYFLILIKNKNNIFLINDIFGNFRCYYLKKKNEIYISNYLNNFKNNISRKLNLHEFNFWKQKGYTSGDETFYKELKKIPPNSIFKINKKLSIKSYFGLIKKINYNYNHENFVKQKLIESLNILKKNKQKIILLFSGGVDSTALAFLMKQLKIKFIPIYFATIPNTYESNKGLELVKRIGKFIKIKPKILKIKLKTKKNIITKILRFMRFDLHTSIVQFEGIKKILGIYGKNIQIISGQSSDSIFCYGASTNSLSHIIIRFMNIFKIPLLFKFIKRKLEKKYKKKLIIPTNDFEYKYYFYNSFFYYPFKIYQSNKDSYIKKKIYKLLNNKEFDKRFDYMRLKIFGFLQGPDNMVLIQAGNSVSFYNIFLPFADALIIESICTNQSTIKNLFFPKYEVRNLIKNGILREILKKKVTRDLTKIEDLIINIKKVILTNENQK